MGTKLASLFGPLSIRSLRLSNRIIMPAMCTGFASEDSSVTQQLIDYFVRRARGGAGLLFTEYSSVHPQGRCEALQLGAYEDRFVPGLAALAESVHHEGGKIAMQLVHGGRQSRSAVTGAQLVAPSAIPCPARREMPRALSTSEIAEIVDAFGAAAGRAKEAGFDAVEIHGAHGYLVSQFLSPWANRRRDEYGSDLRGRARFALEVVRRIRDVVGAQYPISFRISGDELVQGGQTLEEACLVAPWLVDAGVDMLHVSVGLAASGEWISAPMAVEPGYNLYAARAVKQAVRVPVAAVGRIGDPLLAESIVASGSADLVAMGRALLADPDLPTKAVEGSFDDIRRCIGCCDGCGGSPIQCNTNPELGREGHFRIVPANPRKRVVIVGGGPAGTEAAHLAARRGHEVVLFEQEEQLGGEVKLAATPPHKAEIWNSMAWRVTQLQKCDVKILLGTRATPESVVAEKPDAVVIAAGARPARPDIPGINRPEVVTAFDVLRGTALPGKRVAVLGGGMVGCETAEYLADRHKEVTILEMLPELAGDMPRHPRSFLLKRLAQLGVNIVLSARVQAITEHGVLVARNGTDEMFGGFHTIVLAMGAQPNNELVASLKGSVPELYVIGDAAKPRRLLQAIGDGADVGLKV